MKYKIIYHGGSSSSSSSSTSSRLSKIESNNYFTKVDDITNGHLPAHIQSLIFCFGKENENFPCGEGQEQINNFSFDLGKNRVSIIGTQSALWCPIIWNALNDDLTIPDKYLTYGNEYLEDKDIKKVFTDVQKKRYNLIVKYAGFFKSNSNWKRYALHILHKDTIIPNNIGNQFNDRLKEEKNKIMTSLKITNNDPEINEKMTTLNTNSEESKKLSLLNYLETGILDKNKTELYNDLIFSSNIDQIYDIIFNDKDIDQAIKEYFLEILIS